HRVRRLTERVERRVRVEQQRLLRRDPPAVRRPLQNLVDLPVPGHTPRVRGPTKARSPRLPEELAGFLGAEQDDARSRRATTRRASAPPGPPAPGATACGAAPHRTRRV